MAKKVLICIMVLNTLCIIAMFSIEKYWQALPNIVSLIITVYVYPDIKNAD